MNVPIPFTVNVPLEYVALPPAPTCPISVSSHPTGKGCDVTVKRTALLSFMSGPTDTSKGPEVAPVGIVARIDVLLHKLIVSGNPFNVATLLPWVAPKFEPLMVT